MFQLILAARINIDDEIDFVEFFAADRIFAFLDYVFWRVGFVNNLDTWQAVKTFELVEIFDLSNAALSNEEDPIVRLSGSFLSLSSLSIRLSAHLCGILPMWTVREEIGSWLLGRSSRSEWRRNYPVDSVFQYCENRELGIRRD